MSTRSGTGGLAVRVPRAGRREGRRAEGEARKMPEEFAKGKVTAKKEEVLTPEAPTRVKTFS